MGLAQGGETQANAVAAVPAQENAGCQKASYIVRDDFRVTGKAYEVSRRPAWSHRNPMNHSMATCKKKEHRDGRNTPAC